MDQKNCKVLRQVAVGAAVVLWAGMAAMSTLLWPTVVAGATPASGVIQSQDTNKTGVVADLIECKRTNGVLSVRIRLRNTSNGDVEVPLVRNAVYDTWYVTGAGKKYFVLTDSDKTALASGGGAASSFSSNIEKGGAFMWWAKYPAPPAEVKSVTIYTPITGPFDDVPISDQ
jgi:hypothetical protein